MTYRPRPGRRRGVVLIIVLVVVVVLSLAAYTFSDLMLAHRRVAEVNGQRLQARMLVDSGAETVKMYLLQDDEARLQNGGHYDNPFFFQGAVVIPEQDPRLRGTFTVVAPVLDETGFYQGGVRYGLEDESTRLNLNLVMLAEQLLPGSGRQLLMALPGMTEDVADAILDWLDEDIEAREYGAEFEDYYATLSPAYEPRNGPLQSVEELLLVRGVTPDLLFGIDFNRNGVVDAHETNTSTALGLGTTTNTTSGAAATDSLLGFPERGWSAYLTLYSSEKNVTSAGVPRIYLNNPDLTALQSELSEVFSDEWVNFILAYRLYGPADDGSGGGQSLSAGELELDLSQSPQAEFSQVLDLIGARVSIPQGGGQTNSGGGNQEQSQTVNSPFANDVLAMATYLTALMDNCTVSEAAAIPGRININEAPREILLGIPATTGGEPIMSEEMVDQIINLRSALIEENSQSRGHETWLLGEAVVTLDEMKALMPFICGGGDVYRCQIVGYFQGGGPSSRAEIVFDATGDTPAVLFWRDISHLGRGYALETLGVDLTTITAAATP